MFEIAEPRDKQREMAVLYGWLVRAGIIQETEMPKAVTIRIQDGVVNVWVEKEASDFILKMTPPNLNWERVCEPVDTGVAHDPEQCQIEFGGENDGKPGGSREEPKKPKKAKKAGKEKK